MKKILLVAASILFLVASCTVEKRVYRNGFNVQWHAMNGISKKDKNVEVNSVEEEIAVAQVIKAPKANVSTSSTYEAISEESTTTLTQNDVASLEEAPIQNEVKSIANDIKGMAAVTIQNSPKSNEAKQVSKQEMKALRKAVKTAKKSDDVPVVLLYLLCFIFPFIAVGIVTDWDITAVIVNILWTFLCGIPGIIHALIIVGRNT
jgi:uncharacterized membrane protein YqaE (UPF0057 family)